MLLDPDPSALLNWGILIRKKTGCKKVCNNFRPHGSEGCEPNRSLGSSLLSRQQQQQQALLTPSATKSQAKVKLSANF